MFLLELCIFYKDISKITLLSLKNIFSDEKQNIEIRYTSKFSGAQHELTILSILCIF